MKYEIELEAENINAIFVMTENNESGIKLDYIPVKPVNEANIRKRWRANKGENYYYVSNTGCVCNLMEEEKLLDDTLYNFGNYYRTREDANFASEYLKVKNKLELYTNNETEANSSFWIMGYDSESHFIKTMVIYPLVPMSVPFTFKTKQDAEAAIHDIGEERLIKYFFKIKEKNNAS